MAARRGRSEFLVQKGDAVDPKVEVGSRTILGLVEIAVRDHFRISLVVRIRVDIRQVGVQSLAAHRECGSVKDMDLARLELGFDFCNLVRSAFRSGLLVDIRQDDGAALTLSARVHSKGYANRTGQRLFVPLCPIHQGYSVPVTSDERTEPLYIDMGYQDEDHVDIQLPDGYIVEAQPKDICIEKPFGTFSLHMTRKDQTLHVSYRLLVRARTYPAPLYADFAAFIKSVAAAYGQKIVLRQND